MHVENGRKRVERVAWQAVAADTAESGSPATARRGGERGKKHAEWTLKFLLLLPFFFSSFKKETYRKKKQRKRRRGDEQQKRKTKEKRKKGRKSWVKEREGEALPRTFWWVTNLYEFAWFIGRKFNNGRPDPPLPFPRKRGCGERVAADSGIYDTLVWIPASPSNSTIFHRDTWYSGPIIDSARIYTGFVSNMHCIINVLCGHGLQQTFIFPRSRETPSAGGVHSERSTKLSGCVALSIAPAENSFCKLYSSFSRREKNFYYEQIEFLTGDTYVGITYVAIIFFHNVFGYVFIRYVINFIKRYW